MSVSRNGEAWTPTQLSNRVGTCLMDVADLLEAFGENPHRVRAYRVGAGTATANPTRLARHVAAQTVANMPGIGRELAAKITEIVATGTLVQRADLRARIPSGAVALGRIPGVSEKLAVYLHTRLFVRDTADLRRLAATHMLRTIPWLDADVERYLRQSLNHSGTTAVGRARLDRASFITG